MGQKQGPKWGHRSVTIGGNASRSQIIAGNGNVIHASYEKTTLPPPESVNIVAELASLRSQLAMLDSPDLKKIANALSDAEEELNKDEPERDEVGRAIERALGYAEKANNFAGIVENLVPQIKNIASWLGENWHKIISVVGLAL